MVIFVACDSQLVYIPIYLFVSDPKTSVYLELATSISLSWILLSGSVVDSYEVVWRSDQCPDDVDEGNATTTETSYKIRGLRAGTSTLSLSVPLTQLAIHLVTL